MNDFDRTMFRVCNIVFSFKYMISTLLHMQLINKINKQSGMSIKPQKASQSCKFWQNSQYNKIISNKTLLWTIKLNFKQLSNKKNLSVWKIKIIIWKKKKEKKKF